MARIIDASNVLTGYNNLALEVLHLINEGNETIVPGVWPPRFGGNSANAQEARHHACGLLGLDHTIPSNLEVARIITLECVQVKNQITITLDNLRTSNRIRNIPDTILLHDRVEVMQNNLNDMQDEIGDLRNEIGDLRNEIGDLRNETGALRTHNDSRFDVIQNQLNQIMNLLNTGIHQ